MKAYLRLKGEIRPEKQRSAGRCQQSAMSYQLSALDRWLPAKPRLLSKTYYLISTKEPSAVSSRLSDIARHVRAISKLKPKTYQLSAIGSQLSETDRYVRAISKLIAKACYIIPRRELSAVSNRPSGLSNQSSALNRCLPTQYLLSPNTYKRIPLILIILVFVSCGAAMAQEHGVQTAPAAQAESISGIVISAETGQPLEGATVRIKNGKEKSLTNKNGEFLITTTLTRGLLLVSYIGYETVEEYFSPDQLTFDIQLIKHHELLEEVILDAGYYSVSQKLSTGNIKKITHEVIQKQPVNNPLLSLHGRVPGMTVSQTSGLPGSGVKLHIRGYNSLTQGSEPLFIVDGVPLAANNNNLNTIYSVLPGLSPFSNLNSADIESIEILKDADATAIYGSRGANGVVLITTKQGARGTTQVKIDVNSGFSEITRSVEMMNTDEYLSMRREAFKNDNLTITSQNAPDILLFDTTKYTNFKDMLIGNTARYSNANLSFEGGDQNTSYLVGAGYRDETTVLLGDLGNKRGSLNLNLRHRSGNGKLGINLSSNYSVDANNLSESNSLFYSLNLPPMISLYDFLGNLNWNEKGWSFQNPLAYLQRSYKTKADNWVSRMALDYSVSPELKIRSRFGYNTVYLEEELQNPISSLNPASTSLGSVKHSEKTLKGWIVEPQLEYEKEIGNSSLSAIVGGSFQSNINKGIYIVADGYTNDALLGSLSSAGSITSLSNNYSKYRYIAFYGRINYNYENKYIINLTGRRDGSSRFGPDKRFANFGAIGAAWIFSNENFIRKNTNVLSHGKLRFSYGITGNDQIGDYGFFDLWRPITNRYQNNVSIVPNALYNPDYRWEINKKGEVGAELAFLNDRLVFNGSYYINKSGNQLINYALPAQTGFNYILRNFDAVILNKGLELELNTIPIASKNVSWNLGFNISLPKTVLNSFPELETSSYSVLYMLGKSTSSLIKLRSNGIDPETGLYSFEDNSGGNQGIWPGDRTYIGNLDPVFYGGFNNQVAFKAFRFSFFFEFKKQIGENYLHNIFSNFNVPGMMFNQPRLVLNRWQREGDITDIPKFGSATTSPVYMQRNNILNSDIVYSDASYIRLKNIALDYKIPDQVTSKLKMSDLSFYVNIQNPLLFTKYMGSDPEVQNLYDIPPLNTIIVGFRLSL